MELVKEYQNRWMKVEKPGPNPAKAMTVTFIDEDGSSFRFDFTTEELKQIISYLS